MFGRSRFDARFWLVTLSTLLMAGLTFSLGVWQLSRAAQKERLSDLRANTQIMSLSGQWLPKQTAYVDNRQMTTNGQTKQGFFVVTPFVTSASEFVLVERGWIPRDFYDRTKLASIDTPSGHVTINVRKVSSPVPPAVFVGTGHTEYPIVQFVDVAFFVNAMPDKTYKGMVQQMGAASEGLTRDWYEPASGSSKNYGYAFQWFAMSVLVLGLYVWFQWIKNERN